MADLAFKGTFLLENANPATVDFSNYVTGITGGPERNKIAIEATLGTDHAHEVVGHSLVPFGFSMRGLTTALKSTLITYWEAKTWIEVIYRPLTGAASTTNPEEEFHLQLVNCPTAPRSLTEDYVFTAADINVAYWSWTDTSTTKTRGTAQL